MEGPPPDDPTVLEDAADAEEVCRWDAIHGAHPNESSLGSPTSRGHNRSDIIIITAKVIFAHTWTEPKRKSSRAYAFIHNGSQRERERGKGKSASCRPGCTRPSTRR